MPVDRLEWTSARARDYMLAFGGTDAELAETFALALVDVCEERDEARLALALTSALHSAIGHLHHRGAEIRRQRDTIDALRSEVRALTAAKGRA